MIRVLGLLVIRLLMIGMPMLAAMLLAARLRVRSLPVLLSVGLAAGGALAMLGFWMFYADPSIGKVFAFASLIACTVYVCWSVASGRADRQLLRALLSPLGLWALGTTFLVFYGFLHGGASAPVGMATNRFGAATLPSDSDIPQFFAGWFYVNGHHGTPPIYPGVWEMTDRPPLQIGYILLQRPWGWDTLGLNYQLAGVALQQLWIIGLWALLIAARVPRVTRMIVMLVVLVSGLTVLNGFFVWPKLLPAAMLLACAALVITPIWSDTRDRLLGATLIGALIALGMLGHGTSLFAAIALAVAALIRGIPRPRWILVFIASFAALYAPWSAYQKWGDPPGDRLTKWFLGGDIGPDNKPALSEILHAYRSAGISGTLHNKADNFVVISGGSPAIAAVGDAISSAERAQWAPAIRDIRTTFFFFLIPSLGFLLVAPFLIALRRWRGSIRGDEWHFTKAGFWFVLATTIIWGLILWGGDDATAAIQSGSYAVPIISMAVAVTGMRACYPRVANWVCALTIAFALLIYTPALDPVVGSSYSPLAIVLAILSLTAFAVALARTGDGPMPPVEARRAAGPALPRAQALA